MTKSQVKSQSDNVQKKFSFYGGTGGFKKILNFGNAITKYTLLIQIFIILATLK